MYSTYLGGSSDDIGYGIAVDTSGGVYVTGVTSSTDFLTFNAFEDSAQGGGEAFVAKLLDVPDFDGDWIPDATDNCVAVFNRLQEDTDSDTRGDSCDNCIQISNVGQEDADFDGVGDACDVCPGFDDSADADSDSVPDGCDVCPGFDDLADSDSDGVPDSCDVCFGFDDFADGDGDIVPDSCDNCPEEPNPGQEDANSNGIGDACECPIVLTGDVNQSTTLTSADIIYLVGYVFKGAVDPLPCPASGDVNCSGAVTSADIIYLVAHVFKGGLAPCDVCELVPGEWSCP